VNINVSQAKAHLGQYVRQAARGKRFIICARNRPVAELRGLDMTSDTPAPLKLGVLKGQFSVPADFTQPLREWERTFYGES